MSDLSSTLVFFPAPSMGHIQSTLELAKLIIQRNERISISFYIINLPIESTKLNAYVESQSRDNPYPTRLKFFTFPPLTNPPDPHSSGFESLPIQILLDNKDKQFPPVYPVGPILDLGDEGENESVLKWLDTQPKLSVVFICFGSMAAFKEDQIKEIANGLERCGYNFVWSLAKPLRYKAKDDEMFLEALPDRFLEHVAAHKGKILGWAPQTRILSHPAIGGFVTHCGWNSILESLWFGVPIATWPLMSEQQLNAFELVKELGLAVEIRMDF